MVFALIGLLETTADHPALSILPSLVGSRDLDRANSRISATQLVADEFIGPPFGGLMFAAAMALPLVGLATGAGLGGLLATVFDLAMPFLAGSLVFIGCAVIA
ncbi:hypothetical protein [Paeniglutamicibacter psychrophenolicus]|uniref:hypothetical protein n=1 Tax=Paeniglutamicibacter psychrophenolicus TaxID=257454 RepID=UPI0027850803|nr:hypothetical protein [Paeniglutamicibacter psychrophenolicus]MDQ0095320.1 hypothetical protein [Paeniglutamicibacter psychrophenolicus]